jgi:hypothetical protein
MNVAAVFAAVGVVASISMTQLGFGGLIVAAPMLLGGLTAWWLA